MSFSLEDGPPIFMTNIFLETLDTADRPSHESFKGAHVWNDEIWVLGIPSGELT